VLGVRAIALKRILNETLEHGRQKLVPTYHPSYVLRLRDQDDKDEATRTIIEALRHTQQLTKRQR
jgi:DNA polymerase